LFDSNRLFIIILYMYESLLSLLITT